MWMAGQEQSLWARAVVEKHFNGAQSYCFPLCSQYSPHPSAVCFVLFSFPGPLFPHRAQGPPPHLLSSPFASRTFARTGTGVAMWCWSLMPKPLSR